MQGAPSKSSFPTAPGSSRRCPIWRISSCPISISTKAWCMPCCARAEWKSARWIFWGQFSSRVRFGGRRDAIPRLREEFHQQFDSREEVLFGSRVMREPKFERAVEPVILGFSLHQLQHAFRVDLVVFLEDDVAARGPGINFSDAEVHRAQLDLRAAEQG